MSARTHSVYLSAGYSKVYRTMSPMAASASAGVRPLTRASSAIRAMMRASRWAMPASPMAAVLISTARSVMANDSTRS